MAPGKAKRAQLSTLLPVFTGSFLSYAMTALSLMAVPVLLETTTSPTQLFHQWTTMYGYGHRVLPGLAIVTALLYIRAAMRLHREQSPLWMRCTLASVCTVCIIPFTLIFMADTNDTLFWMHRQAEAGLDGGLDAEYTNPEMSSKSNQTLISQGFGRI